MIAKNPNVLKFYRIFNGPSGHYYCFEAPRTRGRPRKRPRLIRVMPEQMEEFVQRTNADTTGLDSISAKEPVKPQLPKWIQIILDQMIKPSLHSKPDTTDFDKTRRSPPKQGRRRSGKKPKKAARQFAGDKARKKKEH